jgi:hypothetical protein
MSNNKRNARWQRTRFLPRQLLTRQQETLRSYSTNSAEECDRQIMSLPIMSGWVSLDSSLMPTISEAAGHEAIAEMTRRQPLLPATTIGITDGRKKSLYHQHNNRTASQAKTPSRQAASDATHNLECLACGCHYSCVDDLAYHQRVHHGLAETII